MEAILLSEMHELILSAEEILVTDDVKIKIQIEQSYNGLPFVSA